MTYTDCLMIFRKAYGTVSLDLQDNAWKFDLGQTNLRYSREIIIISGHSQALIMSALNLNLEYFLETVFFKDKAYGSRFAVFRMAYGGRLLIFRIAYRGPFHDLPGWRRNRFMHLYAQSD
ncbi:hypothetical protein AVEN_112583-1 [Araneus ventricosus]|uniref:Uncharacterized protein n=1 Tax=Araneus ventricosus TaxID=182803 RepID=A0A4Y2LEK9_ARAVE|nr:hypothetical protein AVEN_112583-1 [Araneus ventricosus]